MRPLLREQALPERVEARREFRVPRDQLHRRHLYGTSYAASYGASCQNKQFVASVFLPLSFFFSKVSHERVGGIPPVFGCIGTDL